MDQNVTSLESLTQNLFLSNWIQFHGSLPKTDLAKILRRSSSFVLSSIWENQPVALLEALTCGLPVVAPAIGGIPEIITAENGLLFKPGDVEDLADKLAKVVVNISAYNSQAIHSSALENFSPDVVGKKLDQIYQRVIKNRHVFDKTTIR